MTNFREITHAEFFHKSWNYAPNFLHCRHDALCSLGLSELRQAMTGMPIAFICTDGEYSAYGVQGVAAGVNLFVRADGKWICSYVPLSYRVFPFCLQNSKSEKGKQALCIYTDSNLLFDGDSGEQFFGEDKKLSPIVQEIEKYLFVEESRRKASSKVYRTISEHNLLIPWELKVDHESGAQSLGGLSRIDEDAFNKLSTDAYAELRLAGAIPVIYCQIFSMAHLSNMALQAQQKLNSNFPGQADELNFNIDSDDSNLSFNNI